jgi:hypothetical protein
MKMFDREVKDLFKQKPKDKVRIRIKKGSIVYINGARAQVLGDVIVETNDPHMLMCKKDLY